MAFLRDGLHVNPDALHLTAHLLHQEQMLLGEQILSLRRQRVRLAMAWQGDDAEAFLEAMRHLEFALQAHRRTLRDLARLLSRQADLWLESDQRWAQIYRGLRASWRNG